MNHRNRKPAGVSDGGQFAETAHPGEVSLSQPLRLNESSPASKKPVPTQKVTVKVSGAGQATLKYRDGKWVNPSFLGDKDMRTIACYNFKKRKGCKEATQQVVTDMLNEGAISTIQYGVKAVCQEIATTGHNTTGWSSWPNTGAGASTLHYNHGTLVLTADGWNSNRVIAACKTYQYLHEGTINSSDPRSRGEVEKKIGELVFKAGSLIDQHQAPWATLEDRLRNAKHVSEVSDYDSIGGEGGTKLTGIAECRLADTDQTFLEIAALKEPLIRNRRWQVSGKGIRAEQFTEDCLMNMVCFVAANPTTSKETLETCQRVAEEMKKNGHDWIEAKQRLLDDLRSIDPMKNTRAFGVLAGMIRLGIERRQIGEHLSALLGNQSRHQAPSAERKRHLHLCDMAI